MSPRAVIRIAPPHGASRTTSAPVSPRAVIRIAPPPRGSPIRGGRDARKEDGCFAAVLPHVASARGASLSVGASLGTAFAGEFRHDPAATGGKKPERARKEPVSMTTSAALTTAKRAPLLSHASPPAACSSPCSRLRPTARQRSTPPTLPRPGTTRRRLPRAVASRSTSAWVLNTCLSAAAVAAAAAGVLKGPRRERVESAAEVPGAPAPRSAYQALPTPAAVAADRQLKALREPVAPAAAGS